MNYTKLVFRETSWPDVLGKTITIDFAMNEIIVDSFVEGVKWCRIGSRERSTIEAKLNTSRPEEWAENYFEPVMDGMMWDLKLFEGSNLVKESGGCNGFPPNEHDLECPKSFPAYRDRRPRSNGAAVWREFPRKARLTENQTSTGFPFSFQPVCARTSANTFHSQGFALRCRSHTSQRPSSNR